MHLSEIKDVIVAIAAIITACIAISGLKKWEAELKGRAYFEAAKNLIKSLYKLRNEIAYCRSPFISSYEFPEGYSDLNQTNEDAGRALAYVYKKRWEPVGEALQEFDSAMLEAEALWGCAIKEKSKSLRSAIRELNVSIDAVIADKFSGGENFQDKDFAKSMNANVSSSGSQENQLTSMFEKAFNLLEQEIKPHLRRS